MHRHFKTHIRAQNVLFKQQQHGVEQPPQYEIPRRPVPKAGGCPHDKNIENMAQRLYSVSAKRDIQVIAEPPAERNMPAAPEFRDA